MGDKPQNVEERRVVSFLERVNSADEAIDDDLPEHDYDDYDDSREPECLVCAGDGGQWGCDLGDPLWYDDDEWVRCSSCGGSGLAKDMTWC